LASWVSSAATITCSKVVTALPAAAAPACSICREERTPMQ